MLNAYKPCVPSTVLHSAAEPLGPRNSWPRFLAEAEQRIATGKATLLDQCWAQPELLMRTAGIDPDGWQTDLMRGDWRKALVLCSRQSGKSTVGAALALLQALLEPGSDVMIISRALRQASELLRKVKMLHRALCGEQGAYTHSPIHRVGTEVSDYDRELANLSTTGGRILTEAGGQAVRDNVLTVEFANGSRIQSMPGTADSTVGPTVALLVIDEAARVPDVVYSSLKPTLIVSKGRLVCLSTPFGKRGWFWDLWDKAERNAVRGWHRVKITATECPRIDPAFLEEERQDIGERWFKQEYLCSFEDTVDSVFSHDDISELLQTDDDFSPLFG